MPTYRRSALQEGFLSPIVEMCELGRFGLHPPGGTSRIVRRTSGRTITSQEDFASWILLADLTNGRRSDSIYVPFMPEVSQLLSPTGRGDESINRFMSVRSMGNGYCGSISDGNWVEEIFAGSGRLFFQVGGGRATSQDHRADGQKIHLATHHL